eukprot:TRINITY_DN11391_c0_g1_i2.p1 TRINITY_DN11391_c0_g1~~TRINITY_DN11391_c0_g1_i2.p1  ORF type:complete len:126 (+),score=20.68 TRINITY_DN11391_c0_g1_i2:123-500(+)
MTMTTFTAVKMSVTSILTLAPIIIMAMKVLQVAGADGAVGGSTVFAEGNGGGLGGGCGGGSGGANPGSHAGYGHGAVEGSSLWAPALAQQGPAPRHQMNSLMVSRGGGQNADVRGCRRTSSFVIG